MIEKPQTPESSAAEHQLTVDEWLRLLFLSFKFSQGDGYLQGAFFAYIKFQNPNWKISPEMKAAIEEKFAPMAEKYLSTGPHKSVISAEKTIRDEIRDMYEVFDKGAEAHFWSANDHADNALHVANKTPETNLAYIVKNLIDRDDTFSRNKRPGREDEKVSGPSKDPYLSHLCYYGFLKHNTGSSEFDKIFRDATHWIIQHRDQLGGGVRADLAGVIQRYNEHHPDEKVEFELSV